MVAQRFRPALFVATGVLLALTVLWSSSTWQASASPTADESTVVAVTPVRILDTRAAFGVGLTGPFVSPVPRNLQVTGPVATTTGQQTVVPDGATGVLLNVTVVTPTADGFISVRPAGTPGPPATSSLNFLAGDIAPNSVQVSMPTSGPSAGMIEITYDAYGQLGPETDVLVDVVAYTTGAGIQSLVAQLTALDVQLAAKADPARIQLLTYTGTNPPVATFPALTKLRDLGTFTKATADSVVRLTWQSEVFVSAGGQCVFQIRVDDVHNDGSSGDVATEVVVRDGTIVPVTNVTVWDGLAAGEHTISLWYRGVNGPQCVDNVGDRTRSVLVEELAATFGGP